MHSVFSATRAANAQLMDSTDYNVIQLGNLSSHNQDSYGTFFNLPKTQCQDEFRILSGRTQKLKVARRCWKQLNEHNLMYIYHKQCENMQKIQ